MKRCSYLAWMAVLMTGAVFATGASTASSNSDKSMKDACSVTCYEKTPTCYVTQGKDGCLDISNEKPDCTKAACVCKLAGCETKKTINLR